MNKKVILSVLALTSLTTTACKEHNDDKPVPTPATVTNDPDTYDFGYSMAVESVSELTDDEQAKLCDSVNSDSDGVAKIAAQWQTNVEASIPGIQLNQQALADALHDTCG